ncbi:hypothetical protein [Pseudovibrio sp. SPO723]|nr:hypothetical protein [Pseudovibrio sp. SPO723]MDX5593146.1 hypothetical protein [Pseudovibrio sp. SPO723]
MIIIGLAIVLQATRAHLEKRRLTTKAEAGMQGHEAQGFGQQRRASL